MSPRACETDATSCAFPCLFWPCFGLVSVYLGDWPCAVPWCWPVELCGVWREKKDSDAHLGVRVKQVSLGLTQWRCS